MTPTAEQLAARLNPTPVQLNVPGQGEIFRLDSQMDPTGAGPIYYNGPNGLQALSWGELATSKYGENADRLGGPLNYRNGIALGGQGVLKDQYGIDFNSIPTKFYNDIGHLPTSNTPLTPDQLKTLLAGGAANIPGDHPTVNNTPNQLAPGVKPGVQPATIGIGGITYDANLMNKDYNPNIGNPVQAPTGGLGGSPTLPTPQGHEDFASYASGLAASLETAKATLSAGYDQQIKNYQTKIDAYDKQQKELQTLQENGMSQEYSVMSKEVADKQAALEQEQAAYKQNFEANQKLTEELDGLLQKGNDVVTQMRGETGLSSILNPRITQTMSDISARAGVIKAVMDARNGQIGQAQSQLKSSLDAITSIAKDQIDYYKSVVDFYQQMKKDNQGNIDTLTKDQKTYMDAKIGMLEDAVKNAQNTYGIVQKAMMDPTTALAYAKAGVTLNDTPAQINQKLAVYDYSKEISDNSNKMAAAGYSSTPIAGVTPVTTTDTLGNKQNWYKQKSTGGFTIGNTRFDAEGNVIAVGETNAQNKDATVGGDLADAKAKWIDSAWRAAHPNIKSWDDMKQIFLSAHPKESQSWDAFYTNGEPQSQSSSAGGGIWSWLFGAPKTQ